MQVLVTSFSEVSENEYIDPRTAQVAVVDHVKQVSCSFFKLSASYSLVIGFYSFSVQYLFIFNSPGLPSLFKESYLEHFDDNMADSVIFFREI